MEKLGAPRLLKRQIGNVTYRDITSQVELE